MKYGMLTTLIPNELEQTFKKNSKGSMQDAASVLQKNLLEGFNRVLGYEMPVFNILPAGSFPQYYKRMFVKSAVLGSHGKNLGFCNIKFIRNYFISRAIYKNLNEWCKSQAGEKTLIVYTLSFPQMKAIAKLKQKHRDLKVCSIVADLPDMCSLSSKRSQLQRLFIKFSSSVSYNQLSNIDAFVLLTEQMASYMNINKPYIVVEGAVECCDSPEKADYSASEIKTILYTGTLHRKFGVLHLLDAFSKIQGENYRLIICGLGDSQEEIKAAAKADSRIIFKGQLDRSEVLKLQKNATVLVNPRLNNDEFTKYSFPSKTMEYLLSGVPVVAYMLDGMPKEYAQYINSPIDDSASGFAKALTSVCEMSARERENMGAVARQFVLENKNSLVQSRRILDFLRSID